MITLKRYFFKSVLILILLMFNASCEETLNSFGRSIFFGEKEPDSCDKATEYKKQAEKLKLELDLNPPKDYVERINIEQKIDYLLEQSAAERAKCYGRDKKKSNVKE